MGFFNKSIDFEKRIASNLTNTREVGAIAEGVNVILISIRRRNGHFESDTLQVLAFKTKVLKCLLYQRTINLFLSYRDSVINQCIAECDLLLQDTIDTLNEALDDSFIPEWERSVSSIQYFYCSCPIHCMDTFPLA